MSSASNDPISNFETNAGSFRASRANGPSPEMKKRVMDIEDVLSWVYRDELPKNDGLGGGSYGPPAYVSPLARMVATGGMRVDNWSHEPGFPSAMGLPHPDALIVAAAIDEVIAETGKTVSCLDSELQLVPDLAGLGVDEAGAIRTALKCLAGTVARCAKLRERPFWTSSAQPRPVYYANHRQKVLREEEFVSHHDPFGNAVVRKDLVQVEVRKAGEYPDGAFSPVRYDPDPQMIAEERAEYLTWWGVLHALALKLSGKLDTIAVLPPGAAQRPWISAEDLAKPPRIFDDLKARVYQREQRETAAAVRALGLRGATGLRGSTGRHSAARTRGVPVRSAPQRPILGLPKAACNVV